MPFIEPEDYDREESKAQAFMPNRVIEAYRPEAFLQKGYPSRIAQSTELYRFADAMCEDADYIETVINQWLDGLTEEEFRLLKCVCVAAADISKQTSGCSVIPARAALAALFQLRVVRALFPTPNHVIHELGPGSGYLGAMLSLLGYTYSSMDVTQALYVYQSRLFNHICGEKFIELASDPRPLTDWNRPAQGTNIHIPWWKYVPNSPEDLNLDVDCIVVTGAIAEMNINATKYLVRQAYRWLGTDSHEKAFLVMGPGDDSYNKWGTVLAEIYQAGLELVYEDKGGFDGQTFGQNFVHIFRPSRT